jgi:hypothetical protein
MQKLRIFYIIYAICPLSVCIITVIRDENFLSLKDTYNTAQFIQVNRRIKLSPLLYTAKTALKIILTHEIVYQFDYTHKSNINDDC